MSATPQGSAHIVSFEALEPRLLLAGNILAHVLDGSLHIDGSRAAESITITETGGDFVVTGNAGTTVNGSPSATFSDVTGYFRLSLRGGADAVKFDAVVLPGDLRFSGGSGADALTIQDSDVTGNLFIRTGLDNDSVDIGLAVGTTPASFGADVRIRLGDGADSVDFGDSDVAGRFTLFAGLGNDDLALDTATFAGTSRIRTGGGADGLSLLDSDFDAWTRFRTGGGEDDITVDGSAFADAVGLRSGSGSDSLDITDTDFSGDTRIKLAGGADTSAIEGATFDGPLDMTMNGGADSLEVTDTTVDSGAFDGGHGNDEYTDGGGNTGVVTRDF